MNTNHLKKYAPQARRDFRAAITQRLNQLGIHCDAKGQLTLIQPERAGSVLQIGGLSFAAGLARAREKLVQRAEQMGFEPLVEQMAYTWFNRLSAIRFMELHGYLDHNLRVLSSGKGRVVSGELWMPEILDHAQDVADALGLDRERVIELKLAGNKDEELYRILLLGQCHQLHQAMPFLFEALDDETELLLPDNLTRTDSILRGLVDSIPEDDWQPVEIIGWLYQFYISEKKDQVIGSVVKSEDIPAATQLFTPNWIVKYLVQNSVGRQWLMTYPDSGLKARMEYYIEPAEQEPSVVDALAAITPTRIDPETLKVLDPACGSGHILVEAYDILKAIYEERGYRVRDIPKLILEKNLYGLDIDDRAAQLAGFALMMKAREDDRRIFTRDIKLNVLAIQSTQHLFAGPDRHSGMDCRNPDCMDSSELAIPGTGYPLPGGYDALADLWRRLDIHSQAKLGSMESIFDDVQSHLTDTVDDIEFKQLRTILALFEQAKTFGSLIQVPHEQAEYLRSLTSRLQELAEQGDSMQKQAATVLLPYVHQAWLLAQQYDAVVANPPYMGGKGMNAALKDFAKKQFPDSKSDLFAMFIERGFEWCKPNGFNSMVTMQSWMFLSSYESMRERLLKEHTLSCMVHMGNGVMGIAFGTAATIFTNKHINHYAGSFSYCDNDDLNPEGIPANFPVQNERLKSAKADNFGFIPGAPISYWVSEKIRMVWSKSKLIAEIAFPRKGLDTGENEKFLRRWFEVSFTKITPLGSLPDKKIKWVPCQKGGARRRWYGNHEFVVLWENSGVAIKGHPGSNIRNERYYGSEGVTWSTLTSGDFTTRYCPSGFIFESKGAVCFPKESSDLNLILGFTNTRLANEFFSALSPTMDYHEGPFGNLPIIRPNLYDVVVKNVEEARSIAKQDWDFLESSMNFIRNPIIHLSSGSSNILKSWKNLESHLSNKITALKKIEEENNRLFIDAYDLQNEFSPEISADQVTLIHADQEKDIQRLISYAIGCMMGRYRLDRPGLIYAHAGNVDFWQIYEGGVSDEWLVTSGEKKPPTHHSPLTTSHLLSGVTNNEQRWASKELSGFNRVAEIDGIGRAGLSDDQGISERGVIRTNQSDSACGSVDSVEHRRGTSAEVNSGISQFSIDSTGIESGSRNTNAHSATPGLCNEPTNSGNYESAGRDFQNAQHPAKQASPLTSHSPLTTRHFFKPDEDGILPLTDQEWFKDDATNRFREFLLAVWGEDTLQQNLEFVAESLTLSSLKPKKGETSLDTVRRYLSNQFYKDHLQTYKKRPIYWLFSSGKQKAFECLVYLHRYNESTLARMRTEYVTPLLGKYSAYADQLNQQLQDASSSEATRIKKEQQTLEKKQAELRQFDDKLKHYADMRIKIDLDDGVKVNYGKFGDLLAEVKAVTGGKGD